MKFATCLLALLAAGTVQAGQMDGDAYVGSRYGRIVVAPPAGVWEIIDRESAGSNDQGGPVADLQARRPVAGMHPVVRITGVRKIDSVSADEILRTSRDALEQQGGTVEAVQSRSRNGRPYWVYDGRVSSQGQQAGTRLMLVEGQGAFFLLQTVAPVASFGEAAQALDDLLPYLRY